MCSKFQAYPMYSFRTSFCTSLSADLDWKKKDKVGRSQWLWQPYSLFSSSISLPPPPLHLLQVINICNCRLMYVHSWQFQGGIKWGKFTLGSSLFLHRWSSLDLRVHHRARTNLPQGAEQLHSQVWKHCLSAFFIGPESDHWECLSLADSLTH